MTDRELLEMAAKAAGIKATSCPDGVWRNTTGFHPLMNVYAAPKWNPLTDDGDAFRLAAWLNIPLQPDLAGQSYAGNFCESINDHPNVYASLRRAIVRAAAEIGRAM